MSLARIHMVKDTHKIRGSRQVSQAVARCPTKLPLTRDAAIIEAGRIGYPVVPYRCPGGDHWHVGASQKNSLEFINDRARWESRPRNNDLYTHNCLRCEHEWSSTTEFPSKCPKCFSNSYDVPLGNHLGSRGKVKE